MYQSTTYLQLTLLLNNYLVAGTRSVPKKMDAARTARRRKMKTARSAAKKKWRGEAKNERRAQRGEEKMAHCIL